jgi:hypothetical protein
MHDMAKLWNYIKHHRPNVLTGVPASVPDASMQKRAWARQYPGSDVQVICCNAREKCRYALPGDIIIDDREM